MIAMFMPCAQDAQAARLEKEVSGLPFNKTCRSFIPFSKEMKCAAHQSEAVAVCAYCGRALCDNCAKPSNTQRMVCSDNCAAALMRNDKALESILQKSLQSARASAFYSYLCGGLSAAGAVGAHFYLPVPFLVWFTAGCSLVFIASGIWYGRIAKKQTDG
jgi:hypothetical protein